jgi:hypothetical protein
MVWLALVLLLVAFRRGWVLAPMILFALPFAMPVIEASLQHRGIDLGLMLPAPIEGLAVEMVSIAGLSVLALHRRRF